MKRLSLSVLFVFCSSMLFAGGIPDIFYFSGHLQNQMGFPSDIGIIQGMKNAEVLIPYAELSAGIKVKSMSVAADPGTGNFAIICIGDKIGSLSFKKKGSYCVYGNVNSGLKGYIETGSGAGDFLSRPFFSSDGSKVYCYGLSKYETVINQYDLTTKKFSKFFYNKWPNKLKIKGGSMVVYPVIGPDNHSVAFYYFGSSTVEVYADTGGKEPKKLLENPDIFEYPLYWFGNKIIYHGYDMNGTSRQTWMCAYDTKTQKNKKIFEYTEGDESHSGFPPVKIVYDENNNRIFFMDSFADPLDNVADIYVMSLDTYESEKLVENARALFAVSSDGKYLLFTIHDKAVNPDKPYGAEVTKDKPVSIAVMDLNSGKIKKVKAPGASDYIYLNFIE